MRNRKKESRDISLFFEDDNQEKEKYPSYSIPYYYGILFLALLTSLFGVVVYIDNILPSALKRTDEVAYPEKFIAERAREDLKYLTDLGPRVVGSYENEVKTVAFLKKQIEDIIGESDPHQKIELDIQVASGSYFLATIPTGRINIYANVQNVVAKLYGTDSNNSLLVNAHFDTVPTSPGGGDDGINCATLLEVLRKFSKRNSKPLFNVIFLFNGAEESGLQASHSFISKHKWAAESKVIINLEAGGTSGKLILFQTGPNRPWLTKDYGSVPHPKGQSMIEELFQANVIPSDDDFRVFRDFGNMVGLDMVYIKDSYRYHNKFDGFDNIPWGSYQHGGDNVMVLIDKIANNPELANDHAQTGKMVYFDILGISFISYSNVTAFYMHLTMAVLSYLIFLVILGRFSFGISLKTICYILRVTAATLGGMTLAMLSVIIQAYVVDSLGYSMSWYRYRWLVIGDYVLPIILLSTPILLFAKPKSVSRNAHSLVQAQVTRLIWTFLLILGTILDVRSIHLIFLIVSFDNLAHILIILFHLERKVWPWKLVYITISIVPVIIVMSTANELLSFFIPLCGRIGNFKTPDMIIGLGSLISGFLVLTPYFFLIFALNKPANFYKILTCLFVICFASIFTPLRFPYSGDVDSPTPQRFWILHSQRILHGENGEVVKNESGYFFMNMDRNSPKSMNNYIDELENAIDLQEECKHHLMCGMPLAHPKMIDFVQYSTWIPVSESPVLPEPEVNVEVNSKVKVSSKLTRYNLTIYGTDHSIFSVSPKSGFKLIHMNFLEEMPEKDSLWNDRPFYFFVYTCGKKVYPLNAIFDIETPENQEGPAMDIAVVGNYVHPKIFTATSNFFKFQSKFPDWVDLTTWVAVYKSWII